MRLTKGCLLEFELNDQKQKTAFAIYLGKKDEHHLFLMNSIIWRSLYNYSIVGKTTFMLFSPRYFDETININQITMNDRIWVKIL